MDLWNAKLQRIDRASAVDPMGRKTIVEGPSIEVKCVLDGVSRAMALTLGAELADTDAVLYVIASHLGQQTLAAGDRVLIQPWDRSTNSAFGAATVYEVRRLTPMAGDHLTHYQCVLKAVRDG